MSLRWRMNDTLICGAKSGPLPGDTYIDDRLHYHLSQIVCIIEPDENEVTNGLWHWRLAQPSDRATGPFLLYVNPNEDQSQELLEMLKGSGAGVKIITVHPDDGIDTPYLAGSRFQLFSFGAIRQFVEERTRGARQGGG